MSISDNRRAKLTYMIDACVMQARWHQEQYTRLEYCQRYFAYLMENERMFEDGNYLENLLHNLSAKEDFSRSTTTGEFQRPYFENRSYGDLNEETTNENELQSPVRKKKKKRRRRRNRKRKVSILLQNRTTKKMRILGIWVSVLRTTKVKVV